MIELDPMSIEDYIICAIAAFAAIVLAFGVWFAIHWDI
jgi:hypothetical protein